LAIVAEIAQRHGGNATAMDVHPQGFRIRISLPLAR
jgi:signal transduction histidine kinase